MENARLEEVGYRCLVGLPFFVLQAHLTPLDALEPFWVRFCDNACCVTNTMFVHELLINIGQHQWQHQAEEPTVPNEHHVAVSPDAILSEMRHEW